MYVIPFLKTELLFKFQLIFSFTPNILVKAVWFMGTRVIILKVNNLRMIQSNFGSKGPNGSKGFKKKKKVYKWQVMAKDHMIICRVGQVV